MQWMITKDHIETNREGKGCFLEGATLPHHFKIYDGDGELYYEGRCDDNMSGGAFDPLDWASGYAGATRIDYLRDGKWEVL